MDKERTQGKTYKTKSLFGGITPGKPLRISESANDPFL